LCLPRYAPEEGVLMRRHAAARLSNPQIKELLVAKVAAECVREAEILVLIGEADARKMYLEEGYPSMHAWCIEFFHFSKDVAYKRIHAARAARNYPVLLDAVEQARLHLSAVRLIAPHLTPENVEELVAAATHCTCEEIEEMLAPRVVRLETMLDGSAAHANEIALTPAPSSEVSLMIPQQAARPVDPMPALLTELAPQSPVAQNLEPPPLPTSSLHAKVEQPEPMVAVYLTKQAHEMVQRAQALLGRDASTVVVLGLVEVISRAEKGKFGATDKPRRPRPRRRQGGIPAHERRIVWKRDQGQCTFPGENGKRCSTRRNLEYDHITPVARGGTST